MNITSADRRMGYNCKARSISDKENCNFVFLSTFNCGSVF